MRTVQLVKPILAFEKHHYGISVYTIRNIAVALLGVSGTYFCDTFLTIIGVVHHTKNVTDMAPSILPIAVLLFTIGLSGFLAMQRTIRQITSEETKHGCEYLSRVVELVREFNRRIEDANRALAKWEHGTIERSASEELRRSLLAQHGSVERQAKYASRIFASFPSLDSSSLDLPEDLEMYRTELLELSRELGIS